VRLAILAFAAGVWLLQWQAVARRLEAENRALRARIDRDETMVGESYAMRQLREQVAMAAPIFDLRARIRVACGLHESLPEPWPGFGPLWVAPRCFRWVTIRNPDWLP